MQNVTILYAFAAGLLSFLSPCALPIYPAFLFYITGMSVDLTNKKGMQKVAIAHSIEWRCKCKCIKL
ncbi:cytochrome c biogenesis CcdA family protein [Virgibacillus necropolis]|uniref:Uncharacterized protein n=1 Tax=Virgibacillus necropolis TaxID=163877 RepID=A0A221MD68_9BACI|nr:cytochrome c biogenesis protein CcdA [Virgibacillus necropolis]ASN05574.1 hypothetical protein CFK40_11415 [Virgibacillus necropolis]